MTNTSATGGYLAPIATVGSYDEALDRQLVQAVAVLSGLASGMIRPRWQPVPPKQPAASTSWCAVGVIEINPDFGAVAIHNGAGEGSDTIERNERLEVLASFYGLDAYGLASRVRDGLQLEQNRAALTASGFGLLETSRIVSAPEFVNQQWVRRADLSFSLTRIVGRTYPVLNLLSAHGTFVPENRAVQPFIVEQ